MNIKVFIKKLRPDAVIPSYKKSGDAGFDLYCAQETVILAGDVGIIPTGLAFAIPLGYEMQIRMRSGASLHTPLILANAPGTIDSGYRGEVGIIARNVGAVAWTVAKGERIAQGVIAPVARACFEESVSLPASERGSDGFGSTGSFK